MYLVWLLMLQKHIRKPITYISLFLLGLIRRALTQALIPHTAVLLLGHTVLFWLLEYQIRCSGNYCSTSLLQGVLSSERPCGAAVLTGRTFSPMLWLCAIFSSSSPRRCLEAPSGGKERAGSLEMSAGWHHTREWELDGKRVVLPAVSLVELASTTPNKLSWGSHFVAVWHYKPYLHLDK